MFHFNFIYKLFSYLSLNMEKSKMKMTFIGKAQYPPLSHTQWRIFNLNARVPTQS